MDNINNPLNQPSDNASSPAENAQRMNEIAEKMWVDRFKDKSSPEHKIPNRIVGSANNPHLEFHIDGNDDKQLKELNSENVVMEFDLQTLKGMNDESLKQLWAGSFPDRPGYVPQEYEIREIRNSVLDKALQEHGKTMDDYIATMKNGEDTGATFLMVKEIGAWETYRKLALTQASYQFKKFKDDYIEKQLSKVPRENIQGNSMLQGKMSYEYQGHNNCFACSMAGIYNNYVSRDPSLSDEQRQNAQRLDQHKVRSFTPRYLSQKEMNIMDPVGGGDAIAQREDIGKFAGAGKQDVGNVIAISDILFESKENGGLDRSDIAVVEKTYGMDRAARDEVGKKNLLQGIKKTIHEAINSGQMVSMLTNGHYVTVVGIDGDKISILDSTRNKPNVPVSYDLETYIRRFGPYSPVELSYLKKIGPNDLDKLKQEYSGLGINNDTGEVVRNNWISKEHDSAHRAGIVIAKSSSDLVNAGDGDIGKYMSESIALHKTTFMTSQLQKDNWKAKNDAGWKESQAEYAQHQARKREEERKRREEAEKRLEAQKKAAMEKARKLQEAEIKAAKERADREYERMLREEAKFEALYNEAQLDQRLAEGQSQTNQDMQQQLAGTMNRRHSKEFTDLVSALNQMNQHLSSKEADSSTIKTDRERTANCALNYCMRKVRQNKSSYDPMEASRLGNAIEILKDINPMNGQLMEDVFGMRVIMEGQKKNYEFRKIPRSLLNTDAKKPVTLDSLEKNMTAYRMKMEDKRDVSLIQRSSMGILKSVKDADPALMKSSEEYRAFRDAAQKLADEMATIKKDMDGGKDLSKANKQEISLKIENLRKTAMAYQSYKKGENNPSKIAQKRIRVSEIALREADMMDDLLRAPDNYKAYRKRPAKTVRDEINYIRQNRNVSPDNIARLIVLKSAEKGLSKGKSASD